MEGVAHTAEVTASTLYEAVALGLAAIRGNDWVMGIAQGLKTVKVRVVDIPIEHEVKLGDFTKWVDRTGGSPREVSDRLKIRAILLDIHQRDVPDATLDPAVVGSVQPAALAAESLFTYGGRCRGKTRPRSSGRAF